MLINIANYYVEFFKLLLVMKGVINRRVKISAPAITMLCACTAYLIIMSIYDNSYKMSLFVLTVIPVCTLFLEGRRKLLLSTVAYLGICCLDDLIYIIMSHVLSINNDDLSNDSVVFSLMNSANLIIIMLIVVLMDKLYYKHGDKKELFEKPDISYILIFIIGQAISLIVVSPFLTSGFSSNMRNSRIIAACTALFSAFFLLLGVMLIYSNSSKNYYKQTSEINHQLMKSKENYYQQLLKNDESLRHFRHDMNNHVICIRALLGSGKYDEAENYLSSMSATLAATRPKYRTGNILVNAIVNDIHEKYADVSLEWEGTVPEKINIDDMDICIIFSNVLENAMAAAVKCSGDKNVSVSIGQFAGSLVITVENTKEGEIKEKNGRFVTSKKDSSNHGLGIINIKQCVSANSGTSEFKYDEHRFKVEIVLPDAVPDRS
ncbi:MAG: GHKL domain-containing protein [Ruminococcus sp.]|nr:GHKL domain-containing protein [Ruminococcus sp.]